MENSGSHVPVLLKEFLQEVSPVEGYWLDGTFGAGGYTKGLIEAGAKKVIAFDCDPDAHKQYCNLPTEIRDQIIFVSSWFDQLDQTSEVQFNTPLDGVVFDLGVSSLQFDTWERGFSLKMDGPLDMRMSKKGVSAADLVNNYSETQLADLFFHFGEERAARTIANGIVKARKQERITSTLQLAEIIKRYVPGRRKTKIHPATKCFMALRIVINNELDQLASGLLAAARVLREGGKLAVITFHSLEDRMVKKFLNPKVPNNRYFPQEQKVQLPFRLIQTKPIIPTKEEVDKNPRARSAKLRIGVRTKFQEIASATSLLPKPTAVGLL